MQPLLAGQLQLLLLPLLFVCIMSSNIIHTTAASEGHHGTEVSAASMNSTVFFDHQAHKLAKRHYGNHLSYKRRRRQTSSVEAAADAPAPPSAEAVPDDSSAGGEAAPRRHGPRRAPDAADWYHLELVLVLDRAVSSQFGSAAATRMFATRVANVVHMVYRAVGVSVALLGVDTWTESDQITLSRDVAVTLENFAHYRQHRLGAQHSDNAQLITMQQFDKGVAGSAYSGTMCTQTLSVGVTRASTVSQPEQVALAVARQMALNFGVQEDREDCTCEAAACIMEPRTPGGRAPSAVWSSCSRRDMATALRTRGAAHCLHDLALPPSAEPVCGNGILEPGEECDCGLPSVCTTPCCQPSTCKLTEGATCATGTCCHAERCELLEAGRPCRRPRSECDLPEFCTGESEFCPADVHKMDGLLCHNGQAHCYAGRCGTRDSQCRLLWGASGRSSAHRCYDQNRRGEPGADCGRAGNQSFVACNADDTLCGRLQCAHLNERLEYGSERAAQLPVSFVPGDQGSLPCRSAIVDLGHKQRDPGLVPQGASCGTGLMCVDARCVPITAVTAGRCAGGCSGRGVCNDRGHCHCQFGWTPPDCGERGVGGSVDSGPHLFSEDHYSVSGIIFLSALALLVPALCVGAVCYWRRRGTAGCRPPGGGCAAADASAPLCRRCCLPSMPDIARLRRKMSGGGGGAATPAPPATTSGGGGGAPADRRCAEDVHVRLLMLAADQERLEATPPSGSETGSLLRAAKPAGSRRAEPARAGARPWQWLLSRLRRPPALDSRNSVAAAGGGSGTSSGSPERRVCAVKPTRQVSARGGASSPNCLELRPTEKAANQQSPGSSAPRALGSGAASPRAASAHATATLPRYKPGGARSGETGPTSASPVGVRFAGVGPVGSRFVATPSKTASTVVGSDSTVGSGPATAGSFRAGSTGTGRTTFSMISNDRAGRNIGKRWSAAPGGLSSADPDVKKPSDVLDKNFWGDAFTSTVDRRLNDKAPNDRKSVAFDLKPVTSGTASSGGKKPDTGVSGTVQHAPNDSTKPSGSVKRVSSPKMKPQSSAADAEIQPRQSAAADLGCAPVPTGSPVASALSRVASVFRRGENPPVSAAAATAASTSPQLRPTQSFKAAKMTRDTVMNLGISHPVPGGDGTASLPRPARQAGRLPLRTCSDVSRPRPTSLLVRPSQPPPEPPQTALYDDCNAVSRAGLTPTENLYWTIDEGGEPPHPTGSPGHPQPLYENTSADSAARPVLWTVGGNGPAAAESASSTSTAPVVKDSSAGKSNASTVAPWRSSASGVSSGPLRLGINASSFSKSSPLARTSGSPVPSSSTAASASRTATSSDKSLVKSTPAASGTVPTARPSAAPEPAAADGSKPAVAKAGKTPTEASKKAAGALTDGVSEPKTSATESRFTQNISSAKAAGQTTTPGRTPSQTFSSKAPSRTASLTKPTGETSSVKPATPSVASQKTATETSLLKTPSQLTSLSKATPQATSSVTASSSKAADTTSSSKTAPQTTSSVKTPAPTSSSKVPAMKTTAESAATPTQAKNLQTAASLKKSTKASTSTKAQTQNKPAATTPTQSSSTSKSTLPTKSKQANTTRTPSQTSASKTSTQASSAKQGAKPASSGKKMDSPTSTKTPAQAASSRGRSLGSGASNSSMASSASSRSSSTAGSEPASSQKTNPRPADAAKAKRSTEAKTKAAADAKPTAGVQSVRKKSDSPSSEKASAGGGVSGAAAGKRGGAAGKASGRSGAPADRWTSVKR